MAVLQAQIPADSEDFRASPVASSPVDLVGVPWKRHGMDPREGLGCWGVVWYAARHYGYEFPRWEQYIEGFCQELDVARNRFAEYFDEVQEAAPGDVVMFSIRGNHVTDHIGIMISTTHFLHAYPHGGVCMSRLTSPVYKRRVMGIYRWRRSDT